MSPSPAQNAPYLDGPWFEDLTVGDELSDAPGLTLTDGHAAVHQAICGDRLRLALDAGLSRTVIGGERRLAHPALVWDVAIGQSTVATGRVIANLFYRDLLFRRSPLVGDTVRTRTTVEALRQTTRRPGVGSRGLVLLRIVARDQEDRVVLDFRRCAMLALRDPDGDTRRGDSVEVPARPTEMTSLAPAVDGWRLDPLRHGSRGPAWSELEVGARWRFDGGDVVSDAPELARLTLNLAGAHHDRFRDGEPGRRLVYGGHAIGLAAARASRALPTMATICGWDSCEHLAPVFEGDTLFTELALGELAPRATGGGFARVRARVYARGSSASEDAGARREVLDWTFIALLA